MGKRTLLEAIGIYKSYDQLQIINDLNIQLLEGEVLAIVGISGAGKSTILRILAGIESYDSGSVVFDGKRLDKVEDSLVPGHEEIQYVAQDFHLLKNRTVLENLKEALLAFKDTFTDKKVNFLLQTLQLSHLQEKRIEHLSGGEKQRLAIARAMASEPEVLLLDEPFTQLDQLNKHLLINALRAINNKLRTSILLVTHQSDEVFQLADRVGVFDKLQLIQLGRPKQVYEEPISKDAAQLFGTINILNQVLVDILPLANKEHVQYAIRPHDILLSEKQQANGLEATIVKSIFMGFYYLLIVDTKDQKGLIVHSIDSALPKIGEIYLQINVSKLMSWNQF